MKNLKNSRLFTFKAYIVNDVKDVLTNIHVGEFMFKSECHYYVEKHILDFLNANHENRENTSKIYAIYKISTIEDTKIEDMLIELIYVKDGKIIIQ